MEPLSWNICRAAGCLLTKLRKSDTVRQIQNGSLLLMSAARPDTGFHVGVAMR